MGNKPKCPKNRGRRRRVGELVNEGKGRGQEGDKVGDSVLKAVWGRFIELPQSGKEGRVVGKGPLER